MVDTAGTEMPLQFPTLAELQQARSAQAMQHAEAQSLAGLREQTMRSERLKLYDQMSERDPEQAAALFNKDPLTAPLGPIEFRPKAEGLTEVYVQGRLVGVRDMRSNKFTSIAAPRGENRQELARAAAAGDPEAAKALGAMRAPQRPQRGVVVETAEGPTVIDPGFRGVVGRPKEKAPNAYRLAATITDPNTPPETRAQAIQTLSIGGGLGQYRNQLARRMAGGYVVDPDVRQMSETQAQKHFEALARVDPLARVFNEPAATGAEGPVPGAPAPGALPGRGALVPAPPAAGPGAMGPALTGIVTRLQGGERVSETEARRALAQDGITDRAMQDEAINALSGEYPEGQ